MSNDSTLQPPFELVGKAEMSTVVEVLPEATSEGMGG
jgi:hypothetical protein